MYRTGKIVLFTLGKSNSICRLSSCLISMCHPPTGPYFIAKAISEIPIIGLCNAIFGSIIYPLVGLQKGRFRNFLGLTSLHSIASEAFGLLIGSVSSSSDVGESALHQILGLYIHTYSSLPALLVQMYTSTRILPSDHHP